MGQQTPPKPATLSHSIPLNPTQSHPISLTLYHTLSDYFLPFEILYFYILHPPLQLKYYCKYCVFRI